VPNTVPRRPQKGAIHFGHLTASVTSVHDGDPQALLAQMDARLALGRDGAGLTAAARVAPDQATGAGSGSVWKSVNNGGTWTPVFEKQSTFAIGEIAIAPSNPNIVWVGTGEVLMARSSYAGTGVFKSTDAGKTWTNMGLHDSHHIGRVLIDPVDPNIVYVAAIGHNVSTNTERGLFKTIDGGLSWTNVLFVNDRVARSSSRRTTRAPCTTAATACSGPPTRARAGASSARM